MTQRHYNALFRKLFGAAGIVGASVLVGLPTLAQTEVTEPSTEGSYQLAQSSGIELSPEGLEILCERFPLNSRCSGVESEPQMAPMPDSSESEMQVEPDSDPGFGSTPAPNPTFDDAADPSYPDPTYGESIPDAEGTMTPTAPDSTWEPSTATPPMSAPTTESDSVAPSDSAPSEMMVPGAAMPKSADANLAQIEAAPIDPEAPAPEAMEAPAEAPTLEAPAESAAPAPAVETPDAAVPTTPMSSDISDRELEQFANLVPQLQEIEQSARQEVDQAIEASGLGRDRFNELYQAQQTPEAAVSSEATDEEQQSFEQIVGQIDSIKQDVRTQQDEVIRAEGLEPERFDQILAAIRQDPTLRQQLQQMIAN